MRFDYDYPVQFQIAVINPPADNPADNVTARKYERFCDFVVHQCGAVEVDTYDTVPDPARILFTFQCEGKDLMKEKWRVKGLMKNYKAE